MGRGVKEKQGLGTGRGGKEGGDNDLVDGKE